MTSASTPASATQPAPPAVSDNCGNPITPTGPTVGGTYTTCEGTVTYTWNYADCEGNSLRAGHVDARHAAFPADLSATAVETDTGLTYSWRDLEQGSARIARLFDSLRLWAEKAKARLQSPATGL